MIHPDFDSRQLNQWIADAIDGGLNDSDRASLNELLASSRTARCHYRSQMEIHARLHLEYSGGQEADFMPTRQSTKNRRVTRGPTHWWIAATAAAACVGLGMFFLNGNDQAADGFATLESSHSARWSSSDLPTAEGSRLGTGTLRLVEGLAVLRFDSGAEVTLEAPADLKLVDAMNCHLLSGIAVADIPKSAIGFRVETPSAMVIDYGTQFAVSVDPQSGETRAQVFEGLIEVQNPATGEAVSLKTGQRTSIEGQLTGPITEGFDERFHPETLNPFFKGPEWILREATQDAYIGHVLYTDSKELLYVKNGKSNFHRKAYLAFDLSDLDPEQIRAAELMLHFEPTGLGLASHVPDATFAVYGLLATDQPWDEKNLSLRNAPANIRGTGDQLIADEVVKLGTFVVPQGVQRGRFGIDDESLAEFLRERTGASVTLIMVRETPETRSAGLIHGIASHRHPTLPAPTLAFRLPEP